MDASPPVQGDRLLISLQGVTKSFQGRKILDDIGLEVHAGEILTVVGPNGAGKSTLIRIALGLLKADNGKVDRAEGLKIGYVPQRLQVDEVMPLTVRRFLSLHPRATPENIREALKDVRAGHLLNNPVQAISGGEMQRALLARALIGLPDLLVLDEPVQGVDVAGQGELYRLIENLRDRLGCGIIMISHDLHMVMAATDRVICLNHHVCCSGTPQAVGEDPVFQAMFGIAAGSLALYAHEHNHDHNMHGDIVHSREHDTDGGHNNGPSES